MKKRSEVRKHHIQMLLSDQEREKLDAVLKTTEKSGSELMRKIFFSFYADWEKMSEEERCQLWRK